jgi:hypothetical protein
MKLCHRHITAMKEALSHHEKQGNCSQILHQRNQDLLAQKILKANNLISYHIK